MNGKVIKLNDYKFNFGQETIFLNVFAVFKSIKNGNKYIIYSYDNKKLYCGSAFVKNNEIIVMISKGENDDDIKKFVKELINNNYQEEYEIISLDKVNSIQVIDEAICDIDVDINKLNDITIPKPKVVEKEVVPKKKVNFTIVFLLVFILVVAMFFFFNPEVINGKNVYYTCSKSYVHEKLPASVIENVELEFNGHGTIIDIKVKSDYIFNDVNYYKEFRDKSYFYQYFSDGDTYKFDDSTYTYKLFSSINTKEDFFLPTDKDGLIKHYQDDNYTCKVVDN